MPGLEWLFGIVCGQNPAHTWAPGGEALPCCQRCTGLYAGALLAIILQLFLKPRPTARFLKVHGLFLLIMVPFGYHWVSQGPILRTVTGLLFGAGLVTFLMVSLRGSTGSREGHQPWAARMYFTALASSGAGILAAAVSEWPGAAVVLSVLVAAGALALVALVALNGVVYALALWRFLRSEVRSADVKCDSVSGASPD